MFELGIVETKIRQEKRDLLPGRTGNMRYENFARLIHFKAL
jgi:hypothetical protein